MKKLYILVVLSVISSTFICSCKENQMETYNDKAALYFEYATYGQKDSINHSFFVYDEDVTFDTVRVVICMTGYPENYDRPINLIQTNSGSPDAAIPGTHFVAFDDPDIQKHICMPAGQVKTEIPVVMLRDKSLNIEKVRMELTIGSNEYFRPGIDKQRNFVLTTTAMAEKPNNWDTMWRYAFGPTWGSVKMKFIIDSTGLTDFTQNPEMGYRDWLSATAKQALIDYNMAHPDAPLCEADGSPVTFN